MLTVEDAELKDAAQYFVSVSIGTQNFSSATSDATATPKWGAGVHLLSRWDPTLQLGCFLCTGQARGLP